MRQLASVLSIRRGKAEAGSTTPISSDGPSRTTSARFSKSRSGSLLAKAPIQSVTTTPSGPPTTSRPLLTPGSSSSSDGSASLRTPDDDNLMTFPRSDDKKKWGKWFGWRKSSTSTPSDEQTTPITQLTVPAVAQDLNDQRSPRAPRLSGSDTDDDEDDTSSDSSVDDMPPSRPTQMITEATSSRAQTNLRALMRNKLQSSPAPPPLVDISPTSPQFPRSSNPTKRVCFRPSIESNLHTKRLLRRLDRKGLSHVDIASIVAFGNRPMPVLPSRPGQEKKADDELMAFASNRVSCYSRGLRNWTARPCFEERVVVYFPNEEGEISMKNVQGTSRGLAVEELDFSDRIAVMAGFDFDDITFEQAILETSDSKKTSMKASSTKTRLTPNSQPLITLEDQEQADQPSTNAAASSTAVSALPSKSRAPKSGAQRGVRFLDPPDPDDDVPLGYAVQAKKKREEKEKFLRAERERRSKEVEENRIAEEEDRRRREEEKRQLEEMKQEKYREELAAARHRRESVNFGLESLREARQRERSQSYSRPDYDPSPSPSTPPRRRSTEIVKGPDFPGGSRPSSILGSSEDVKRNSIPEEDVIYATSVGFRPRRNRKQSAISEAASRASQAQSVPPSRHPLPRSQSSPIPVPVPVGMYPMMFPHIPPVHPMAMQWNMPGNMPLLPPVPPFMMQQYPSYGSPTGSYANSRDSSPSRQSSGPHTPPSLPYNSGLQVPKQALERSHRNSDPTAGRRSSTLTSDSASDSRQGTWPRTSVASDTRSLPRSRSHLAATRNDKPRQSSQLASRTISSGETRRRTAVA